MKSTVWIFGDSFQTSNYPKTVEKSWIEILLNDKGHTVKNLAKAGVSNEDIILTCIDYLPSIKTTDTVLIFLGAELRFMIPTGTGEIDQAHDFDLYINTDRKHIDVWSQGKIDRNAYDIVDKFNTPLGNKLKMSVWNNYIAMLLDSKNIKYKIIHGHYEPKTVSSDYVIDYMPEYKYRCWLPNVTKYFTTKNNIQFISGTCLINDFFHCQIQHLIDSFGKQQLTSLKNLSLPNFVSVVDKQFGQHNCYFYDTWHLNQQGHVAYANYAQQYNWITDE